jgi:hypothetical protein
MTKMITSLLEHKDQVEHWIDGKEAEGTSAEDTCLFDSNLLINAVPKILALMEVSMNDALSSLPGSNTISLDDIIAEFKAEATVDAKKEAAKTETQAMFSILSPLLDSEEGKELIKNFEEMPGIYYDPKGNFLGAKEGLLKALADCVRNIDNSKIFSTVVPPFVSGFLTGDDSPLKELFGDDIVIDTNCVDSTGKSIVGREFAKLIDVLADCQDVIGFAYSLEANGNNMRALEKSFSHMCSLETPNHEKQLVKLLTAFADNKILNPEVGGKKNTNFYGLFKNVFAKLNMESNELSASMEAIICSDTFDAES